MNREELINSIDATDLGGIFTDKRQSDNRYKIWDYKFTHFCSYPSVIYDMLDFAGMSNVSWVSVFNFPHGRDNGKFILDSVFNCINFLHEADIVAPSDDYDVNNFMSYFYYLRSAFPKATFKLIIEPYLYEKPDENYSIVNNLEYICNLAIEHKFDYIKSHTGFGYRGVTVEDIHLLKDIVGDRIKIKASGGIKTLAQLLELRDAGATRFGVSIDSAIKIIQEYDEKN